MQHIRQTCAELDKQNSLTKKTIAISATLQYLSPNQDAKQAVTDLGFYKGGCPLRQKRAPAGAWGLPQKIWKSTHSLIHFPGISGHYQLYDWVCFYDMSGVDFAGDTISIVQKGHPKQRAGVRTPWTPPLDTLLKQGIFKNRKINTQNVTHELSNNNAAEHSFLQRSIAYSFPLTEM